MYNVAGPRSYTLLEVLGILEDVLAVRAEPIHTGPRAGDIRHSLADLTAARRDLGYEPAVELPDGLRLTAESLVRGSDPRREEAVRE